MINNQFFITIILRTGILQKKFLMTISSVFLGIMSVLYRITLSPKSLSLRWLLKLIIDYAKPTPTFNSTRHKSSLATLMEGRSEIIFANWSGVRPINICSRGSFLLIHERPSAVTQIRSKIDRTKDFILTK